MRELTQICEQRLGHGAGYALCLDAYEDQVALATSERVLQSRDCHTLALRWEARAGAHESRINELCFPAARSLYSASSDGTVKVWDLAASVPVTRIDVGEDIWSVHIEGSSPSLALGCESAVVVWDLRRTATPLARYEIHTEAVTQVRWRPGTCAAGTSRLLSAAMDGLICEIDCTNADEEEAVVSVLNTESPVVGLGLCGAPSAPAHALPSWVWALSACDELSLWNLEASERCARWDGMVAHATADVLGDEAVQSGGAVVEAEPATTASTTGVAGRGGGHPFLDHLAGCAWDVAAGCLLLAASAPGGTAHVAEVIYPRGVDEGGPQWRAATRAGAAATDRLRAFHYRPHDRTWLLASEDGSMRLCSEEAEAATEAAKTTEATKAAGSSGGRRAVANAATEVTRGSRPASDAAASDRASKAAKRCATSARGGEHGGTSAPHASDDSHEVHGAGSSANKRQRP